MTKNLNYLCRISSSLSLVVSMRMLPSLANCSAVLDHVYVWNVGKEPVKFRKSRDLIVPRTRALYSVAPTRLTNIRGELWKLRRVFLPLKFSFCPDC